MASRSGGIARLTFGGDRLERPAVAGEAHRLVGKPLPPAQNGDVDVLGRQLDRPHLAAGALPGDEAGAGAAERLEDDLVFARERQHDVLGKLDRKRRRMAEIGANGAVVALDADDAVGNAERLGRLATMRPGVERAVLAAHAGGAGSMADLTSSLAGDDLVRLSGLAVEVEHQLEGGGKPAGPVARHAGALVPH